MKDTVNTYFAVLLIVIAGAVAAWLIVHVATTKVPVITGSEASYTPLKDSILKQ